MCEKTEQICEGQGQRVDKTALSYWFPIIEAAGLPVPRTIILDMPDDAQRSIWSAFDGVEPEVQALSQFAAQIEAAADTLGWPCFLRTDHTSGKHNWSSNCFLANREAITSHLYGVAEYSEMAGFIGLPWNRWAVREMLPTKPLGVCTRFGDMPICKEFRFFVDGPEVTFWQPYWPQEALEQGEAKYAEGFDLAAFYRPDDLDALKALASKAGKALGGAWSVDLLETERGWFLTDMAEADKSYRWDFKAADWGQVA